MAANKFRCRLNHDVGSPLEGTAQDRGSGGVVDHQGHALLVGNGGEPLDVGNVELGIAQGLGVDGSCFGVDGCLQAVKVIGIDKAYVMPRRGRV